MHVKLLVLVFCVSAAVAYPAEGYAEFEDVAAFDDEPIRSDLELLRTKRQFNMQGGGSPRQGYDIDANARFPIWQSQNQRNSVHGTAGYSQHLGGPYGNSHPDVRGGIQFTHRF